MPAQKHFSLKRVFVDELFSTRLDRDYVREIRDLYYFYLSDDDRQRLAEMGRLRRSFVLLWWTLKNMLAKLSPPRRLLILIACVIFYVNDTSIDIAGRAINFDLRIYAFVLLLLVLMLELKDKLVARDEIEIARQVQMALLPATHPELPGWSVWSYSRPAKDVGGDLVDYLELDGFRHGVLIGDVAGKGLGAALLSAKLQATFRALVPDSDALDDLGTRVNSIFANDSIRNRYATLFYAVLEHHSGQLRYLNAGHNPAYVIRKDGIDQLKASSFPVGMFDTANYQEACTWMEPGDMLLAYSDGLTEAMNVHGDEFGEERVEQMLPGLRELDPAAIGRHILREVDRFCGDARPNDDMSLVVVVRR